MLLNIKADVLTLITALLFQRKCVLCCLFTRDVCAMCIVALRNVLSNIPLPIYVVHLLGIDSLQDFASSVKAQGVKVITSYDDQCLIWRE